MSLQNGVDPSREPPRKTGEDAPNRVGLARLRWALLLRRHNTTAAGEPPGKTGKTGKTCSSFAANSLGSRAVTLRANVPAGNSGDPLSLFPHPLASLTSFFFLSFPAPPSFLCPFLASNFPCALFPFFPERKTFLRNFTRDAICFLFIFLFPSFAPSPFPLSLFTYFIFISQTSMGTGKDYGSI